MNRVLKTYLPALLFFGAIVALYVWDAPIQYLIEVTQEHSWLSYVTFVGLMFVATVVAPITVLPLVPMLAPVFGPFVAGLLSVIGWTSGAMVAFLIARYFGRPVVQHFISLEAVDKAIERIPEKTQFFMIVLIRMALPVDALSYALGFVKGIPFWSYSAATALGVSWFSFVFAYMGTAYIASEWPFIIGLGSLSLVVFVASWYVLLRQHKGKDRRDERTDEEVKSKN